jgi:uncharacterized protein YjiS (DUF1127 family)
MASDVFGFATTLRDVAGVVRTALAGAERIVGDLLTCLEVARQRRRLAMLDERSLKDFGVGRAEAEREAGRSLFDIPEDLRARRPARRPGPARIRSR